MPRPGRGRYQEQIRRLRDWARKREKLPKSPTHEKALTGKYHHTRICEMTHFDLIYLNVVALQAIEALYQVPASGRSSLGKFGRGKKGQERKSLYAERERRRREGIRLLYEELEKIYGPPKDGLNWTCPKLLSKGKLGCDPSTPYIPLTHTPLVLRDLESLPKPSAIPSA